MSKKNGVAPNQARVFHVLIIDRLWYSVRNYEKNIFLLLLPFSSHFHPLSPFRHCPPRTVGSLVRCSSTRSSAATHLPSSSICWPWGAGSAERGDVRSEGRVALFLQKGRRFDFLYNCCVGVFVCVVCICVCCLCACVCGGGRDVHVRACVYACIYICAHVCKYVGRHVSI